MNLIIGNVDKNMQDFIKKQNFKDKTLVINKMCNVKYIQEPIVLYIPFGIINKYGILSNTMVHIEELLITLNVLKIYYSNDQNDDYMSKLEGKYFVEISKIESK